MKQSTVIAAEAALHPLVPQVAYMISPDCVCDCLWYLEEGWYW